MSDMHVHPTGLQQQPQAHQLVEHADQVLADGAAQAAVVEHHDALLLLAVQPLHARHQLAVDVDLAELRTAFSMMSGNAVMASSVLVLDQ